MEQNTMQGRSRKIKKEVVGFSIMWQGIIISQFNFNIVIIYILVITFCRIYVRKSMLAKRSTIIYLTSPKYYKVYCQLSRGVLFVQNMECLKNEYIFLYSVYSVLMRNYRTILQIHILWKRYTHISSGGRVIIYSDTAQNCKEV